MTPSSVHAESGHRLGASHPRQEGPTDCRLIPPAVAAWGAAALALGAPATWAVAAATGCLVAAAVCTLVAIAARRRAAAEAAHGPAATETSPGRNHHPSGSPPAPARTGSAPARTGSATAAATVLLCAAVAAGSAVLHAADVRRGPLPELARNGTAVTLDATVTGDPRLVRPRVRGATRAPAVVMLEAEATRVAEPGGRTTATRTPVLLLVRQPGPPADSSGGPPTSRGTRTEGSPPQDGASSWLRLLPSTEVRLRGLPVPPLARSDHVAVVLRVTGSGPPRVTGQPSALQRTAGDLRAGLREASEGLSADARALLPGLVVGDTSRIPADLDDAFRSTDLTHLLAVSGANLSIVLFLLIGPPGLAGRAERRGLAARLGIPLRTTAVLGGILTLAFVVVCRPQPSVLRAAACGLIALLAVATGRRRSLLPALAGAVLLLLLYDPWLSRSYGFLLSVLATAALLTLAPRWSEGLQRRRVPARLAEVLAAAAAAQAVCAPVVAVLAARVSLVAIPCNLLAELAIAPATVLGFAALAAAPIAMPVAKCLARAAGWPVTWIAGIARTGAALPGAEMDWPGGWTGGLLLALASAVGVVLAPRLLRRPWLCAACALFLLLAVLRPLPLPRLVTGWPPPDWRLAVCDVGQGDALVLSAGRGTAVVVDAGPEPDLADNCLRALGITRIPLIVLTHFHADHVAGLPGVLRGRAVGAIETTTLDEPPDQAEFVRRVAAGADVPVLRTTPGQRNLGPLSWNVLWPPPESSAAAPGPAAVVDGANDASVTLLVRTAGLTLLLLGDLEPAAQQALLTSVPDLPPVDVLKVAHHGSAYQEPRLLGHTHPRLAVISCGDDNPYGHPSPRTLAALREVGATVLRTDTDGAIAVTGTASGLGATVREGRAVTPGGAIRSSAADATAATAP